MPVERKREGDNVIYEIKGQLDATTAHQFADLNLGDYQEIGDAIGAIVDYRQMTGLTIPGLRAAQARYKGLVFNTPSAFVGNPDSLLVTFLRGLEALTSRGTSRFGFFDNVSEAVAWVDAWYDNHQLDRERLRGQVTVKTSMNANSKQ
jgi:hypothetical protein